MHNLISLYTSLGEVKLADFGLARTFPSHCQPPAAEKEGRFRVNSGGCGGSKRLFSAEVPMTMKVVTLWYRAPELLLGMCSNIDIHICAMILFFTLYSRCRNILHCDRYVGCRMCLGRTITGEVTIIELFCMHLESAISMQSCIIPHSCISRPLLPGDTELDQIHRIFALLGCPSARIWADLPTMKVFSNRNSESFPFSLNLSQEQERHPFSNLQAVFPCPSKIGDNGLECLNSMLTYDPKRRITVRSFMCHWSHGLSL